MFTGIVETTGRIRSRSGEVLALEGRLAGEPLAPGESIAVDGVCLTVTRVHDWGFEVDVSQETLARTTLGRRAVGSRINLERALTPASRLGGHLVMGHVDTTTRLETRRPERGSERWRFHLPAAVRRYVAFKGSVALDGVSLTIAERRPTWFEVALIPHTLSVTTLQDRRPGDALNLEVDVLARYAETILTADRGG